MRGFLTVASAIVSIGWTAPAVAQKSPEKIRLNPRSKEGAVLIRVPVQPFDYALSFSKNGKSGFGSRVYIMKVKAGAGGFTYIARTLSPGSYRLDSVWQQGQWSVCLEQGTFDFDSKAGRIAFLGTFHVDHLLRTIQSSAVSSGRTAMQAFDFMVARQGVPRPIIDGRDEAGEAEARAFAETGMNGSGDRLDLAVVNETAFATSGFGKAVKICG